MQAEYSVPQNTADVANKSGANTVVSRLTVEENTHVKSLAGLSDDRLLQKTVDVENESGVNTVVSGLLNFHLYRRGEHSCQNACRSN